MSDRLCFEVGRMRLVVENTEGGLRISSPDGHVVVEPHTANVVTVRPELSWDDATKAKIVAEMIRKQGNPMRHRLSLATKIIRVLRGAER